MSDKAKGAVGVVATVIAILATLIGATWNARSYADDTAAKAVEVSETRLAEHKRSNEREEDKVEKKLEALDGKVEAVQTAQARTEAKIDAILIEIRRRR